MHIESTILQTSITAYLAEMRLQFPVSSMCGQTWFWTRPSLGTRRTCGSEVVLCKPRFLDNTSKAPSRPLEALDKVARQHQCALLQELALPPVLPLFRAYTLSGCLQALDKAKRQHQEGLRPEVVHARLAALREEAGCHLRGMAPAYSLVILRHSMSQQTWQDRLFFESLYEALIAVVYEALGSLQSREEVEIQVG